MKISILQRLASHEVPNRSTHIVLSMKYGVSLMCHVPYERGLIMVDRKIPILECVTRISNLILYEENQTIIRSHFGILRAKSVQPLWATSLIFMNIYLNTVLEKKKNHSSAAENLLKLQAMTVVAVYLVLLLIVTGLGSDIDSCN